MSKTIPPPCPEPEPVGAPKYWRSLDQLADTPEFRRWVEREAALDFLAGLSKKAQSDGGQGLSFLLERSSSPSRARLQKLISEKFPKAGWFTYEPVDFEVHRQAASVAFGKSVTPYLKID